MFINFTVNVFILIRTDGEIIVLGLAACETRRTTCDRTGQIQL